VNFGEEIIIHFRTVLVGNEVRKTMFANPFGASVAEAVKKRTVIVTHNRTQGLTADVEN
jgi:hypothetical protein